VISGSQACGHAITQIARAALSGPIQGMCSKPHDHGSTTTASANTAKNTGNIRAARAIRNGLARPPACCSDGVITRPLSTKKTSTAAPPCETAACTQSGSIANGAMCPSST
jgi:hypothetical protein